MTPAGLARLEADEGLELEAYPDPLSPLGKACTAASRPMSAYRNIAGWFHLSGAPWTIGWGCTGPRIVEGTIWTQQQAEAAIDGRVHQIEADLGVHLAWFAKLDGVRADVLVNMAYNMGVAGLLKFDTFLGYMGVGRYAAAALDLAGTGVGHTLKERYGRLEAALRSGTWS
jgi:lysozyme